MLTFKKILVPIDFSEYSLQALKYVADFAKVFDSEVLLIYVVEPIIYPPDLSIGQIALTYLEATRWMKRPKKN
jgi:nucleotide-binding universal stress UspA family protein